MSSAKTLIAKIPAREWKGLVPKWEGGRLQIPLVCSQCGETDHWSAAQMVGPQTAIPKIIQMGWSADGKITCPACIALKKRSHLKLVGEKSMPKDNPTVAGATVAAFPNASEAAKRNKRLVFAALEDYYDEPAKAYREGHSDKTVAEELGVAEAFVRKEREDYFGPIKPPSEIEALSKELAGMQTAIDNLKKKLDDLILRQGWRA